MVKSFFGHHCTQCRNYKIFLSFKFYVKSNLGNLEVTNLPFFKTHTYRGYDFWFSVFLHILKTEIYPINKLQSPNNWKNGKFRNFKFSKNWFHVILCDRKILKFPHRRETLSYFPVKSSTSTYIYSRIFFPSNQAAVEITQFLFTKITWKHFFLLFFQMSYWRTSLPMFTLYVRKSRHFQTKASFTHPYWWKTVWVRHLSCPIHSI